MAVPHTCPSRAVCTSITMPKIYFVESRDANTSVVSLLLPVQTHLAEEGAIRLNYFYWRYQPITFINYTEEIIYFFGLAVPFALACTNVHSCKHPV